MATPIDVVDHKVDALARQFAEAHAENRESLKGNSEALKAIDEKLDRLAEVAWRHDEQIKTLQRGGGGAITFILGVLAALIKDRLHL